MTAPLKVELGAGGQTPHLPLSEVAPLVRRVVPVLPGAAYIELGIRSFNNGSRPSTPHGNEEDRPLLDQRQVAAR
jgi:hypothetical protein